MDTNLKGSDTALVFNIQKCSIHDGPGIRTIVFLKGCPLRCLWCANPESQSYGKEIAYTPFRCIGCGVCIEKCPRGCINSSEDGRGIINRSMCDVCGMCAEVCCAKAKRTVGEEKTPDEILNIVSRDKIYYANSGGGVTFSGGEPLTHPEFLLAAAKACREQGIEVAVETCGCGDFETFAPALEYVNLIFVDIKEIDTDIHRKLTGVGNEGIIENLRRMAAMGKRMIVRMPVVPGYNDRLENFIGIAELAKSLPSVEGVELLAYHALGIHKYEMLGRKYELKDVKTPTDDRMNEYAERMNEIMRPVKKKCWFAQGAK